MGDLLINDLNNYGMELTKESMNLLVSFLNIISNKAEIVFGKADIDELTRYAAHGGVLKEFSFKREDLAHMQKCLQDSQVLFALVNSTDSDKITCIYTDRDEVRVEKAKDKFRALSGKGVSEMEPVSFLDLFRNEKVGMIEKIDRVNLELMRYHLNSQNTAFTTIKKGDTYSILFPEEKKEEIDKALKRTAWDMSSTHSSEIKKSIIEKLDNREKVNSLVQDIKDGKMLKEPYLLINSKDPTKFIEINNNGFSVHQLGIRQIDVPNNELGIMEKKDAVFDISSKEISKNDKDFELAFFKAVRETGAVTVPIKKKNYKLFPSDKDYVLYTEEYKETQKEFNATIAQIDKIYPTGYTVEIPNEKEISYVKNLTPKEQYEILKGLEGEDKKSFYLEDGQLAYKNSLAPKVEKILKEKIYASKNEFEKRLEALRLQGYDLEDESFIIIDRENKEVKPICITEHKSQVLVLDNTHTFNKVLDEDIGAAISNFNNPVILTIDEYTEYVEGNEAQKQQIVDTKVSKIGECFAYDYMENNLRESKKFFENKTKIKSKGGVDESELENSKLYDDRMKAAVKFLCGFAYETIEGKEIKREIENIEIDRGKASVKR